MLASIDGTLQQFEISHYGFLPIDEPLAILPDTYYAPWESIISHLPYLIRSGLFHNEIAKLPLLTTARLQSIPEWRRAYVILTFFTHAFIWSGKAPAEVCSLHRAPVLSANALQILPPNIVVPLIEVSEHLHLPPTATYPGLNLWNCGLVAEGADITRPENVVMRHTFTGTTDEAWFYAVSVSVEAKGVSAIQLMLECVGAIEQGDDDRVLKCLKAFSGVVIELGRLLQRMHERCDPSVFYHRIRPFLAGSRGMEKAGLPRGVFYDEGDGKGSWRQYSGGSNAQSTLIQFLDIALGVRHYATGEKPGGTTNRRQTYLDETRKYMPDSHRQFLEHFASIANIQQYAMSGNASVQVREAFDDAVNSMTAFRDNHIKIVARYIVRPASAPNSEQTGQAKNIASASSDSSTRQGDLKGTGGTNLMTFLKQTRDETRAAKSPTPA